MPKLLPVADLERSKDGDEAAAVQSWYPRCMAVMVRGSPWVQKWGNSLGVRIPRSLAEQIGLFADIAVSLSAKNCELVVKPALPTRLSFDELLADVSDRNLYSSV